MSVVDFFKRFDLTFLELQSSAKVRFGHYSGEQSSGGNDTSNYQGSQGYLGSHVNQHLLILRLIRGQVKQIIAQLLAGNATVCQQLLRDLKGISDHFLTQITIALTQAMFEPKYKLQAESLLTQLTQTADAAQSKVINYAVTQTCERLHEANILDELQAQHASNNRATNR